MSGNELKKEYKFDIQEIRIHNTNTKEIIVISSFMSLFVDSTKTKSTRL